MIDQQEFHHAFARLLHHRGLGEELLRRAVFVGGQVLDAHGAGSLRLRDTLHFDQAHAAIAGDRQPLVETEARDFRARGFAGLEQRVLRRNVDLFAVDNKLGHACFFNSRDPASSLLYMLMLAAPIVALGGRPSRIVAAVVGQIGDERRRRAAPALPEDRSFPARLISGRFRRRPPEPAMAAPQIPVFEHHRLAPRVSRPLLRHDYCTRSCRMLARRTPRRFPELCR